MKIFLSWSGSKSQKLAIILRDWIPSVIQSVVPYVSSEDIDKGARWSGEIAKELDESTFGILCVTKDNSEEPWILFEAGALSKKMELSRVCPLLFDLKRSDIKGPLSQFQSSLFEKEDVRKLMISINSVCGESGISDERLNASFNMWWPNLEDSYNKLKTEFEKNDVIKASDKAKQEDILEEILNVVRGNQRLLRAPEVLLPPDYIHNIIKQDNRQRSIFVRNNQEILMMIKALEEIYSESFNMLENYKFQGRAVDAALVDMFQQMGHSIQDIKFRIDVMMREGKTMFL